jgi:adenosylcobyric acid synthase
MWHGAFENDAFRRAWLTEAATQAGTSWTAADDAPGFADLREEMLEKLADAVGEHLDTAALRTLLDIGAPKDLPFVPPGAP